MSKRNYFDYHVYCYVKVDDEWQHAADQDNTFALENDALVYAQLYFEDGCGKHRAVVKKHFVIKVFGESLDD